MNEIGISLYNKKTRNYGRDTTFCLIFFEIRQISIWFYLFLQIRLFLKKTPLFDPKKAPQGLIFGQKFPMKFQQILVLERSWSKKNRPDVF